MLDYLKNLGRFALALALVLAVTVLAAKAGLK